MSTRALLHHKLERAIVAWIIANQGEHFPGVRIVGAHTSEVETDEDAVKPELIVACMKGQPHPEFDGCGRRMPQVVECRMHFRVGAKGNAHEETIAVWLDELEEIITEPAQDGGDEYSKLIADLNPPASGADTRTIKPLYLYAVHPSDDAGEFDGVVFDEQIGLEIVAQNGDPDVPSFDSESATFDDTATTFDT